MMSSLKTDNSFGIDLLMMFLFMVALPLGISVLMLLLLNAIGVPLEIATGIITIPTLMLMAVGTSFAKKWCWQHWQRTIGRR